MIRLLACLLGLTAAAAVGHGRLGGLGQPELQLEARGGDPEDEGARSCGSSTATTRSSCGTRQDGNVMVPGYEGEPYLRFLKGGRVEVNVNSPAKYLNEERYGGVTVPKWASAKASRSGSSSGRADGYVWHEHRIHWMSTDRAAAGEGERR